MPDLHILIEGRACRDLCSSDAVATRKLGRKCAKSLQNRLADLAAAHCVTDLIAGHPHPLKGDRSSQFAVRLEGGRRLVFRPTEEPPPQTADGATDWSQVTSITIVFIGDYHD